MRMFMSDDEVMAIGHGLIDRTLPKCEWTHAAHFAAAIWMLKCRPDLAVERAMPGIIRGYNEATGVANTDSGGYHETITQASIRAARAFVGERPEAALFEICNELLASPLGRSDWMLAYWSRSRLFSAAARRGWVRPDLEIFPF